MPKMKTLKTAAKRFKRTASGKYKRFCAYGTHRMTGKSSKRKRTLRRGSLVSKQDARKVARMLPYG